MLASFLLSKFLPVPSMAGSAILNIRPTHNAHHGRFSFLGASTRYMEGSTGTNRMAVLAIDCQRFMIAIARMVDKEKSTMWRYLKTCNFILLSSCQLVLSYLKRRLEAIKYKSIAIRAKNEFVWGNHE